MIRHKILDVWVKEDNPASQEVFRWFKYSIEKDYKSIEILSDIKTRKDETEYIKHRIVLKYDNGCISAEVIDMIIKDFYPNYDKVCKHSYVITSERCNICTHEDMYELTCIKCGKTMSINLADPNYINK